MKTKDVPQDNGMIGEYGTEICYAVDDKGDYTLAPSLGWEPKNIVNDQAWHIIYNDISEARNLIKQNKRSPIAYYQARHQMDLRLLSQYVGMARWRVKRHLKPGIFAKLPERLLQKYCDVFEITIDQLRNIPEETPPQTTQET